MKSYKFIGVLIPFTRIDRNRLTNAFSGTAVTVRQISARSGKYYALYYKDRYGDNYGLKKFEKSRLVQLLEMVRDEEVYNSYGDSFAAYTIIDSNC